MCALARVSPNYVRSLFVAEDYHVGRVIKEAGFKVWDPAGTLHTVEVTQKDAVAEKEGEKTGANLDKAW